MATANYMYNDDPRLRVVGYEYKEIDGWLYCQLIYEEGNDMI